MYLDQKNYISYFPINTDLFLLNYSSISFAIIRMDGMLEDELGPASILKMKNHSGVEKISEKMPESDEINDTVESIVNNSVRN